MNKNTKRTSNKNIPLADTSLREIIDYAVVGEDSTRKLTEKVQAAIKDGWRPIGAAQSDSTGDTGFYIQTLVLYGA